MLTLLSLNTEGETHADRVFTLIDTVAPDYLALYEAPTYFIHRLAERGYFSSFAPMCTQNRVAPTDTIGVLTATKTPAKTSTHYYQSTTGKITPHNKHDASDKSYPAITSELKHGGATYTFVAVHLFDTWNGLTSPDQEINVSHLLEHLATIKPHILCGDFNMPRGYNINYERFTERYRDEIPQSYTSSLDRSLHRAGNRTDLNAPIFDIYMVDYVFSQAPYVVSDVQLHFGISDHAAVVAHVTLEQNLTWGD